MKGSKFFVFVLIILILLYLLYQLSGYIGYRTLVPPGTTVGGLDVVGLPEEEARALIEQAFTSPVVLNYADEVIKLHPHRVEFRLNESTLWAELARRRGETAFLEGFGLYLLGEDPAPVQLYLEGRWNEKKLIQFLNDVALEHDRGMLPPQGDVETLTFSQGQPARWLDVEASLPGVEAALNSASKRTVDLAVQEGTLPPEPDVSLLEEMLQRRVADFDGIVGIFCKNLDTGQEVVINGDVAYAGMSILKVPIMFETYRWLKGEPDEETAKLLRETMITSGNFTANLLLRQIGYRQAGNDSAFAGVEVLNGLLQRLGLENPHASAAQDL